jgi:hypothetical protein
MPHPHDKVANLDLVAVATQAPIPRYVHLILHQALSCSAERIRFSLSNESSKSGLRISFLNKATWAEQTPAPGHMFAPLVSLLCSYASVGESTQGPVRGQVQTKQPDTCWLLESANLKDHLVLSKT